MAFNLEKFMSEKLKAGKAETLKSVDDLLMEAGFQTLEKPIDRVIYAHLAPVKNASAAFATAHANALKALGNRAECRRIESVPQPYLAVTLNAEPKSRKHAALSQ
jgi:hypothetical protein